MATTHRALLWGVLMPALWLAGCATRAPVPPPVQPPAAGQTDPREIERGIGSWYGEGFQGRKTASGETFDTNALTAAHRTLPFGTRVRVRNPANGQEVVVRINDRGPFLHGRLIDLSYVAAWKLGLVDNGSGSVVVETVLPGTQTATSVAAAEPAPPVENRPTVLEDIQDPGERGGHYLQLGAFASRDNAESLKARLYRDLGELGDKLVVRGSGSLHRLQLGPWADIAEARRIAEQLKTAFGLPSVLVR